MWYDVYGVNGFGIDVPYECAVSQWVCVIVFQRLQKYYPIKLDNSLWRFWTADDKGIVLQAQCELQESASVS